MLQKGGGESEGCRRRTLFSDSRFPVHSYPETSPFVAESRSPVLYSLLRRGARSSFSDLYFREENHSYRSNPAGVENKGFMRQDSRAIGINLSLSLSLSLSVFVSLSCSVCVCVSV